MSRVLWTAVVWFCARTVMAQPVGVAVGGTVEGGGTGLPPPPSDEGYDRAVIDQATGLIAEGRSGDARRIVEAEMRRRGVEAEGYTSLAVLRRVAVALETTVVARAGSDETVGRGVRENRERTTGEAASFYAGAMALGAGLGGWADVMAGLDDPRLAVWAPLAGAGLGAVGAWLVDRRRPRPGLGAAFTAGIVAGTMGGAALGLHGVLSEGWDAKGMATATVVGGVLGAGVGLGLGALTQARPGSSAFVGSASVWGAVLGGLTGIAAQSDGLGIFAGIGAALGTTVSFATASRLSPSTSQVLWMDLGVVTGGLLGTGLGLLLFWDATNWSARVAAIELGMIGGGVAGWLFGAPTSTATQSHGPRAMSATGSSRRTEVITRTGGFSAHPELNIVPGGVTLGLSGVMF